MYIVPFIEKGVALWLKERKSRRKTMTMTG